ncbi:MAG: hypothetical protein ACK5LR_06585 [Mangrovibacterium sp.]
MNNNWFLAFVLLLFTACSVDNTSFEVGNDLVSSQSKVLLVDTFAVRLSTVQIDSLQASSLSEVAIGKYEDTISGKLDLQHYFKVQYTDIGEDDKFDSLTVKIRYSDYFFGDTLQSVEFSVYQLDNELEIYDEVNVSPDYNYNTTSRYTYDEANIVGSVRFRPYPSNDSIEFKLNPEFGKAFFDWIQDDDNDENTNTNFYKFQKGFVIKRTDTDGKPLVLGFSNSNAEDIQLRMYTHIIGSVDEEDKEYAFNKITDTNMNFSQALYDRTGTEFEDLVKQSVEKPADESENIAVIQGGSGLMVKVDFPTINQINGLDRSALVRTDLILVPDLDANDLKQLPEKLYFYYTNKRNAFLPSSVIYSDSSTPMTASLVSNVVDDTYYYTVNLTNYMASQMLDNSYDSDNGLVVAFSAADMRGKASTLYLTQSKKYGTWKTKLNLYFLENE